MSDAARFAPLSDFEPICDADWRQAVESSPATKPFERKMLAQTLEGIVVAALASDGAPSAGSVASLLNDQRRDGWHVSAHYPLHHLSDLHDDLSQGGLTGAWISVSSHQVAALPGALAALPAWLALTLELSPGCCVEGSQIPQNHDWAVDILGSLAGSGRLPGAPEALLLSLAPHIANTSRRALYVNTTPYHDAGAAPSTELAVGLSAAAWMVDQLTRAGLPQARACQCLAFGLSVDSDFFMQIAKLRASRLLWARATGALGVEAPMWQVVSTSGRTQTRFDPWGNLLRAALQTAAAVLGGADEVHTKPFDALLKPRSAWGRRLARNTQLILRDESKLNALLDPTAGSGQVEAMTAALCEQAWAGFQEIERDGGLVAALQGGTVQRTVQRAAAKRAQTLAKRQPAILGVSDFPTAAEHPLLDDTPLQTPKNPPIPIQDPAEEPGPWTISEPLQEARDAAPFEALRLEVAGTRRVWLVCLGPLAEHLPRRNFAAPFVAIAGVEPQESDEIHTADAALDAYRALGHTPDAVILCGSDARYAALAEDIAARLAHPNLWIAGRPGDNEQRWRAAGVCGFLFMGCDVVAALRLMFT